MKVASTCAGCVVGMLEHAAEVPPLAGHRACPASDAVEAHHALLEVPVEAGDHAPGVVDLLADHVVRVDERVLASRGSRSLQLPV